MKKVGLYVRVSTQEQKQHGLSVESQIDALKKHCEENNYYIYAIYNDAGYSASKSYKTRPALQQMISDCQNKNIDLLLFTKLDRFFRNVPDYYACVEQMKNVPWRAVWEDYETETSSGMFKVNIMLSIAQAESSRTSERIKAVNEYRRASGCFVGGLAPIGYKIENKELVKDPDQEEGINAFFNTYLSTFSPMDAMNKASEYGLKISRPVARRMMLSEVYCGNAYGYTCPAYISVDDHNKMVASVNKRTTVAQQKRTYLFSGLMSCPLCGGKLGSVQVHSTRKGGKKYVYKAYECNSHHFNRGCTNKSKVFESTVEKYLINNIESIMRDYNISLISRKSKTDTKVQIKKLNDKLSRILFLFQEGDISAEDYRTKRDEIKSDIIKLEAIPDKKPIQLPDNWLNIYSDLDEDHKKGFWNNIIDNIVRSGDDFIVTLK